MSIIGFPDTTPKQVESFLDTYSFIDVNHVDKQGRHALFYAVDRADVAITAILISHGSDTTKRDNNHHDVISYAKSRQLSTIVNLIERYPTSSSMLKAVGALRSLRATQNGNTALSIYDVADALAEPTVDHTLLMNIKETSSNTQKINVDDPAELKKQNAELQKNLAQIAEKARQDYGNKAKQRAIEEKMHKEKILEVEKKKKEEEQKGFFAKLFGF